MRGRYRQGQTQARRAGPLPAPEALARNWRRLGGARGRIPARRATAAALLLAGGAGATALAGAAPPQNLEAPTSVTVEAVGERSPGRVLVTLPWGDGAGQVGFAGPGEGLTRGPEALAAAADGRLAVLDSVNRRLLLLDPQGTPSATAPLPLGEPRWLAVDDRTIYVLDSDADRRLAAFDWAGAPLFERDLPLSDDPVTALIASGSRLFVETLHEQVFEFDPTSGGALPAQPARGRPLDPQAGRQARVSFIPGQPVVIQLPAQAKAGSHAQAQAGSQEIPVSFARPLRQVLSLDADARGLISLGVLAEDDREIILARLAGGTERAATLAFENRAGSTYLGPLYHLGSDGRVYQPEATEAGYTIRVHEFGQGGAR